MNIALIFNEKSADAHKMLLSLVDYIIGHGSRIKYIEGKPGINLDQVKDIDFSDCDAAISLGGDGTILAASRHLAQYKVPLFGINFGRVGFLSVVEKDYAFEAIDQVLSGKYDIQERLMLNAALERNGKVLATCNALNDIVVSSGVFSRAVTLDLSIDNEKINSYNADGIIVSTPTGSTGYSLSAGGPIILEALDVTVITPVCPHSFFSRPIVASADSKIKIINQGDNGISSLTADGQFRFMLEYNDTITISSSEDKARFIHFSGQSYFERIKTKLYV